MRKRVHIKNKETRKLALILNCGRHDKICGGTRAKTNRHLSAGNVRVKDRMGMRRRMRGQRTRQVSTRGARKGGFCMGRGHWTVIDALLHSHGCKGRQLVVTRCGFRTINLHLESLLEA